MTAGRVICTLRGRAARYVFPDVHGTMCSIIYLHDAAELADLRVPPGNRLEALQGRWRGFHSIRINDQWRVVFRWEHGQAMDVAVVDYH